MTDTATRSRLIRSLTAVAVTLLWLAPAAGAQDPIPDPSANRTPSQATLQACYQSPTSQTCASDALADLNAARVSEGDLPMVLPRDWTSLTIPQQLLVLSNLERVDRGLAPIEGLTTNLDGYAQTGAVDDGDPIENPFPGSAETSNWEGGYVSPLLSDFAWMYDDGYGSGNLDCTAPTSANCWGHREDILWDLAEPAVMGAAYADATASHDGEPSESEIFVGGDTQTGSGQPDAPIAPTWATIAATLPLGLSATRVTLAQGARTAPLTVWASGETMNVTAAVTTASSNWKVSPTGCQLAAGHSCELTLTAASATPGEGTLIVNGPNGSQSVALEGSSPPPAPATPKLSVKLNHSRIRRGQSVKLTGTMTPSEPGTYVELQQRHGHAWRNVARVELRLGNRFSFAIRAHSKGRFSYRVAVAATTGSRRATSKTLTLTVT